jgi:photosystem II stability/assembly factor-like uncharacterized protein
MEQNLSQPSEPQIPTTPEPTLPKKPSKAKLAIIISTVVAVLAIGAIAVIVLTSKNTDDTTSTANSETATAAETSVAKQLMDRYSSGVIDIQSYDCTARSDNEWYRTDRTLAIDPNNPNTMYVSIEWKGVYRSTDGGTTWSSITKGILAYADKADPTKACHGEYPVIRINPTDSNHLLLVTSGGGGGYLSLTTPNSQTGGIYQSLDGGSSWELVTGNDMNVYSSDAVFSPDGKTIYYATASNPASWNEADQSQLYVKAGLILASTDKAKTWTELPTGIGERTSVTNLFIDKANPNIITAPTFSAARLSADGTGTGISNGKDMTIPQLGVLRTSDGGKTWASIPGTNTTAYIRGSFSQNVYNNQFYVPSSADGSPASFVTTDGGATLTKTKAIDVATYDPYDTTGKTMLGYTTASIGMPSMNLTLWASQDAGITWNKSGTLPSEISDPNDKKTKVSNIVWHPTESKTIFMNGAGGHVWKSTDRGASWKTLISLSSLPN